MRRHLRRHLSWLGLCVLICAALAALPGPRLRLSSSTALLPLVGAAAQALATAFGGPAAVSAMGSSFAVSSVLRGTADLALSDVPYRLRGLLVLPVARLQIAVVGQGVPPEGLSLRDIRRILQGRVRNWREIGGKDAPIRLVLRTPGSGVRVALAGIAGGNLWAGASQALSNGQVLRLVTSSPGAIGFVEAHYAPTRLLVRVSGRLPGQPGYPLSMQGYALYRPHSARGELAARILAAVARREGMAP